jgi:hypothetical protein
LRLVLSNKIVKELTLVFVRCFCKLLAKQFQVLVMDEFFHEGLSCNWREYYRLTSPIDAKDSAVMDAIKELMTPLAAAPRTS